MGNMESWFDMKLFCLLFITMLLPAASISAQTEYEGSPPSTPEEQRELGLMYVGKSDELAFRWLEKAANQGDVIAQNNVAAMYSKGIWVKKDLQKSLHWFTLAASSKSNDKGPVSFAQFAVGHMYLNGQGVRQDTVKAKSYFGLACDNGMQDGCNAYKELNQQGY